MRITAEAKEQARERILLAARALFAKKGFDSATTRDIAKKAGTATGTLFNYFPTKEALAMTLVAEALDEGREEFERLRTRVGSLDEELFLHVITGLSRLKPHRGYIGQVMETGLSPFAKASACAEGERIRLQHLETVGAAIAARIDGSEPSFVAMHLYWSLYLGVLAFWSSDASSNQEETLVVLDQAMRLFVASLPVGERNEAPESAVHQAE